MTVGDTIYISYNNQKYYLDVREVRPQNAASIIETDAFHGGKDMFLAGRLHDTAAVIKVKKIDFSTIWYASFK